MSHRRRSLWSALPILGIALTLGGCGGEILLSAALSAVAPKLLDTAISVIDGDSDEKGPDGKKKVDYMALAEKVKSSGDMRSAAMLYQKAHAADPKKLAPLAGLGESLTAIGDNAGAAEAYQQALAI